MQQQPIPQQRSTPPHAAQQQHAPEQSFVVNVAHQQHHPVNTPSPGVPVQGQPSISPPHLQHQQPPPSIPSSNNSDSSEKANVVKKPFALNPAAKPFTPRIPITPNSSRPHTPQTPGTQINPASNNVYTPPQQTIQQTLPPQGQQQQQAAAPQTIQSHVPQPQPQTFMTYVMQPPQQGYPTPPHPHATQQTRFRKGQLGFFSLKLKKKTNIFKFLARR